VPAAVDLELCRCALLAPEAAPSPSHALTINTSKQSPKQGCAAVSPPIPEQKQLPGCLKYFDEVFPP